MSILQVDGITFGNTTQLNTYYGIIPQNTTMVFYQASAPTGWVQDTAQNDKALRVVSGNGGSFYGIYSVSTLFTDAGANGPVSADMGGSVEETTLTQAQLPAHTHNTGSNPNSYRSSASSSPFRQENRQPRGYNVRNSRRVTQNNRVTINFRQPVSVRQPRNQRVSVRYGVSVRNRQPRSFRRRYPLNQRQPFNFRRPVSFRSPSSWRQPISGRVDGGRWRNPIGIRVPVSQRQPYWQRIGWLNRPVRRPISFRAAWGGWRQRRQIRSPISWRNPIPQRNPVSFRQPNSGRNPFSVRWRQPRSYRRRYPFTQRNPARQPRSYRVPVSQRNPQSYRQPRAYRVVQRYPSTSNVRVAFRTLSPGGTIRNQNTQAPATSSTGGGLGHAHPFNPAPVSWSVSLSPLRVQYIDVILCEIEDAATKFGI